MRQNLTKLRDKQIIPVIVIYFNISQQLIELNHPPQKKDKLLEKCYQKHLNLIDIYGILHPTAEYTFFSYVKGTFTKIRHMLNHKTRFNKLKKIKII